MKLTEREIRQRTWEALVICTEGIPFLKEPPAPIELSGGNVGPDLAARITLPEGEQRIFLECKSVGQPRVARNAVNQILRYLERHPDYYGVFVAPYISPRSAEICSKEGIGYLDFAETAAYVSEESISKDVARKIPSRREGICALSTPLRRQGFHGYFSIIQRELGRLKN